MDLVARDIKAREDLDRALALLDKLLGVVAMEGILIRHLTSPQGQGKAPGWCRVRSVECTLWLM